jgi:uncharacterized protein
MSSASKATLNRARARWQFCAPACVIALTMLLAEGRVASAQEPSLAAVAVAKELIELKGAANMFDPLVPGVIDTAKNTFLLTSPSLAKDLNEVAAQLRNENAAKRSEAANVMARLYAQQFTEKEMKDVLAFFKTPLGKKVIDVEPRVMEQSMTRIQAWADQFSDEMMSRFRAEMKKKGHNL